MKHYKGGGGIKQAENSWTDICLNKTAIVLHFKIV